MESLMAWPAVVLGLIASVGAFKALEMIIPTKESRLKEAALDLQKRQGAAGAIARSILANKERGLQRREQSSKIGSDRALRNIIEAISSGSSSPQDAVDMSLEDIALGDTDQAGVRARDLTDQQGTGDGDVAGILAALASLQEKTRATDTPQGIYARLMGRRNA